MSVAIADPIAAQAYSVQQKPGVQQGARRFFSHEFRTPLLPPPGTRERERVLRWYRHHPYNTIFRGAVGNLVKRLQSTPHTIIASDSDRWQVILMQADFGSWERFLAKMASNFLYHGCGAWAELIAPGNPRFAPDGPVVGIAALDSLRVLPTGNPTYPAIYQDTYGALHLMHHARIVQLVDNEYSEEYLAGYGECALERAIAPVRRDILINQYIEGFLDDKPRPGLRIWQNLSDTEVEKALAKMEQDRATDDGGIWGRVLNVYALDTSEPADVKEYNNARTPEGFDFDKYKNELVREMALTIGLDVQDLWELSGQGIGTGTQSEILAQKSRGKAFGNLLKRFERLINQAFPPRVEFRWEYKDPQEDKEEADKAQSWITVITSAKTSALVTDDEARQTMVNQVPAFKDTLLDLDGNLRRLHDDDIEPPTPPLMEDTDGPLYRVPTAALARYVGQEPPPPVEPSLSDILTAFAQRGFAGTGIDFERYFRAFARVGQAQNFPTAMMRATFREELYTAGLQSYEDGLRAGGADPASADALARADRNRKIGEWLALQNGYINQLVDDINAGVVSQDVMRTRGELWVSKSLRAIYYAGLNDAAGERLYEWQLGATEEHCSTCRTLSGQVHRLKDYLGAGLIPGADSLECRGFNCACTFQPNDGPARGRLPGIASGPFTNLTDRFTSFLQRLGGKAVETPALPVVEPDIWTRFVMRAAKGQMSVEIDNVDEYQVEALRTLLHQMQWLGGIGSSRWLAFYADGDGAFRPKIAVDGTDLPRTEPEQGRWKFNPELGDTFLVDEED